MGSFARRFSGPVIGFLFASGLQVSGIQAPVVAAVLWAVAIVWGVVAFVTWAPVRSRLADTRTGIAERSPIILRSPVVRKRAAEPHEEGELGFLDFEAFAVAAMQRMTKTLGAIAREMTSLGRTFAKYTPKFLGATGWDAEAKRRLGRETGQQIDKNAAKLESLQGRFRTEVEAMAVNYLERIRSAPVEACAEIRPVIVGLREATAESRPVTVQMRENNQVIRRQSVQQAINVATDHLDVVLGSLISDFDRVTRFTTDALRLIDEKIAAAEVEKAEAEKAEAEAAANAEAPTTRRERRSRRRPE